MFNPVAIGAYQVALVDLCLYVFGAQSSTIDIGYAKFFLARVPVMKVECGGVLTVSTPDALPRRLYLPYPLSHLAPVSLVQFPAIAGVFPVVPPLPPELTWAAVRVEGEPPTLTFADAHIVRFILTTLRADKPSQRSGCWATGHSRHASRV